MRTPLFVGDSESDAARESRARRRLARDGEVLRKSRVRNPHLHDQGGYMIVDANANYVVAGADFDLSLEDVESYVASA